MEQSLVEAVQQEREGLHSIQPAAVSPCQIARRNYELLVHRQSTATAALELTCSTSSLSGRGQHPLYHLCCVYCMFTCRRAKTVCCSSFCDSEKLYTVLSAASVAAAANFWQARVDVHLNKLWDAAIVGRTLSQAGRRISTWPSSIPKLVRHQSMDSGLLAAYRVEAGGSKPVGSGPSGSRPRRASLPVQPKRRLSSLFTKDPTFDAVHGFKRPG